MMPCPVCGWDSHLSSKPTTGPSGAGTPESPLIGCGDCGLWYSETMAHPGAEWYAASSIYARRHDLSSTVAPRPDWRYVTFASLPHCRGASLLDIGCGDGAFLAWASSHGYEPFGVDIDPGAVAAAQRRVGAVRVAVGTAETCAIDNSGRRFDVISLFDVLEHLTDPVGVLSGLAKRLSPGGRLVCTVPSHERWPRWFAPHVDLPPHHLTLWSMAAVRRAAERAGLSADVRRSPLLAEHLIDQLAARLPVLRSGALPARLLLAMLARGIALPAAALLRRMRRDAGGFTLFLDAGPRIERVADGPLTRVAA